MPNESYRADGSVQKHHSKWGHSEYRCGKLGMSPFPRGGYRAGLLELKVSGSEAKSGRRAELLISPSAFIFVIYRLFAES